MPTRSPDGSPSCSVEFRQPSLRARRLRGVVISDADPEAAGLCFPEGPHAADRLDPIHYLIRRGATLDDLTGSREELPGLAMVLPIHQGDP